MSNTPQHDLDRRNFLKAGAAGAAAALASMRTVAASDLAVPDADVLEWRVAPIDPVRIGYVGVGLQGTSHVSNLLHIPGVEIRAVCDIAPEKVARAQQMVVEAGRPKPDGYANGPEDFRRLCDRSDLDLVYTATPWEWHVPVCVAAMEAGKHAATEVPAAYRLDDCWRLVETAERTRRHCIQMENCCYDRPEMLCLNLVRKGLLGEILHAEAGYCHDLRAVKFENANEGLWRRAHSMKRNGNLYPTHGLGPVAQCLDINRGDRFDYLVSVSSPSRGLQAFGRTHFTAPDPRASERYVLGDVNVSLIQTALGKVITLYHDTNLPRPYSRIHHVQGTAGLFEKYPTRVYVEGRSPEDRWEELTAYQDYDHPLWKTEGERAKGAGHGGMDYLEDFRLIAALRRGQPLDMDVYDAAAWSAVTPLSEQSVARRGAPMAFPDFMKGRWKSARPLHVMAL
jgi:predicted dehydrogenase